MDQKLTKISEAKKIHEVVLALHPDCSSPSELAKLGDTSVPIEIGWGPRSWSRTIAPGITSLICGFFSVIPSDNSILSCWAEFLTPENKSLQREDRVSSHHTNVMAWFELTLQSLDCSFQNLGLRALIFMISWSTRTLPVGGAIVIETE